MADYAKMLLTNKGLALFNKVQGGAALHFTKVCIGDGELPAGQLPENLSALVSQKHILPIISLGPDENGKLKISASFDNTSLSVGEYIREIGVFATDPDIGEILYYYSNAEARPDYLPPTSGIIYEDILDLYPEVGNATSITATILSGVYAAKVNFDNHLVDVTAHSQKTALTLYVNASTGNDSNDGLTAGTAKKSIQAAINGLPKRIDATVTINIADGDYSSQGSVTINGFIGSDSIVLTGNTSNPDNCIVQSISANKCTNPISINGISAKETTGSGFFFAMCFRAVVNYCKSILTGTGYGVYAYASSVVQVSNSVFSNRGYGLYAELGSTIISALNAGSGNSYGLVSGQGSVIAKNGTQPLGTTKEWNTAGGLITNADGTIGGGVRGQQVLLSTTNLYVRTDGNDANDGSANDTAHAFKTFQAAINSLPKRLDANVTINVANGTYSEVVIITGFIGGGAITVIGNTASPSSVIVNYLSVSANANALVKVSGLKCTVNTGYNSLFNAVSTMSLIIEYCYFNGASNSLTGILNFGACTMQVVNCTFDNCYACVSNYNAVGSSAANGTVAIGSCAGTGNTTVLINSGGIITRLNSTLPAASGADICNGGIIGNVLLGSGASFPASTGTFAVYMDSPYKGVTPTGSCTINASGGVVGQKCTFNIYTSGTTSFTIAFGSSFKANGSIATGTVAGKNIEISFVYDGSTWLETGRTVAM